MYLLPKIKMNLKIKETKNGMQSMSVIQTTKIFWNLSSKLPAVLCSINQFNKSGQKKQIGINACGNIENAKITKQRRNYQGIEITETSFHDKGWE